MDEETVKHFSALQSKDADKIPFTEFMKTTSYDVTYVKAAVNNLSYEISEIKKASDLNREAIKSKDVWLGVSWTLAITCILALLGILITLSIRALDKKRKK